MVTGSESGRSADVALPLGSMALTTIIITKVNKLNLGQESRFITAW